MNTLTQGISTELKGFYTAGVDRRHDLYQVPDETIIQQARSVACLVEKTLLKSNGDHQSSFVNNVDSLSQYIQKAYKHPPENNVAFLDQPAPGLGTAFLIRDQYLLTAAHCVCYEDTDILDQELIEKLRVIFDYQMNSEDRCNQSFETYQIKKVVKYDYARRRHKWADWALLKLDRKVKGRTPLELDFSDVKDKQKVYMLGHPVGLPQKYTSGAKVRKNGDSDQFGADLDAFEGNSGSPVFDKDTGKVIGILCVGNTDFEKTPDRRHMKVAVAKPNGGYELCQRISAMDIQGLIQREEASKSFFCRKVCVLQ